VIGFRALPLVGGVEDRADGLTGDLALEDIAVMLGWLLVASSSRDARFASAQLASQLNRAPSEPRRSLSGLNRRRKTFRETVEVALLYVS
jgi:hypothetical protein